jgi:hypothetical protein
MRRLIVLFGMFVLIVYEETVLGRNPVWTVAGLAAGVAGLMLIVLVHELGHAAAGTLEGLPLRWLAVGPVMVDFGHGRRLRRSPVGGAGGCVVFDPGDLPDEQLAGAWCRMSAAGPVASLLFAVICLGLFAGFPGLPSFLATALQWTGGFSLLGGIANAIPFRAGPFRSDGCTYLILLRGGEGTASLVRTIRLAAPDQSPDRPADCPATTIARMKETMARLDVPMPARLDEWLTSAYLLYWHYADRGLLEEARSLLWRVATAPRAPAVAKRGRYDVIDVVTAVHLAFWERDAAAAERVAARVPKRSFMRRNSLWIGLEAAILMARGDARGALKKAGRAQRRLAPFVDLSGVNVLEQRWWSVLIARAQTALGQTETERGPNGAVPAAAVPVPTAASGGPGSTVTPDWMGDAPRTEAPVVATVSTAVILPETARWLGRGQASHRM